MLQKGEEEGTLSAGLSVSKQQRRKKEGERAGGRKGHVAWGGGNTYVSPTAVLSTIISILGHTLQSLGIHESTCSRSIPDL